MSEATQNKQPTVFILYIPGGAMLGLIPALTLARIESLTETSVPELFQVIEGVSTGSILAAGFNVPNMTAKREAELFAQLGPSFFPDTPGRWTKMHTRQGINTGKVYFGLNPQYHDRATLNDIDRICNRMRSVGDMSIEGLPEKIEEAKTLAQQEWFTPASHKKLLKICEEIEQLDDSIAKHTDALAELATTRTYSGRLGATFRSAAQGVVDKFRDWYAPKDTVLFDTQRPTDIFRKLYGEIDFDETVCSTYISAFDVVNNRIVTFSSLKDDLFDKDPNAPKTTENNVKLWDAVMGSTANELAFKAHITENNILCSDKAPFHKPRSVRDVLNKVDPNTRVVLVIAGTGSFISRDLKDFLESAPEEEEGATAEEIYRKRLEIVRDIRAEFGVSGNLILGRELNELESYTSSDAMDDFKDKLGEENIFEFTPRLSPHTQEESEKFPSRDVLDASRENIKKIIRRARNYCEEEDDRLRELSQMLVDNLYLQGKMEPRKYARVCANIGLKTHDLEAEVENDTKGLENRIASNDNSSGLRKAWRRLSRRIFGKDESPRISPRPKGPGEP